MKHLISFLTIFIGSLSFSFGQIQDFYNYVESNLESYDSADFYFVKTPNTIPPQSFFDMYKLQSGDLDNDIILIKTWEDEQLNMTHYRYQQTYKGVLVEVAELTEHYKGEELNMVNGKIVGGLEEMDTEPQITPEEAIDIVVSRFTDVGQNINNAEAINVQIVGQPELLLAIDEYSNLTALINGSRYTLAWKLGVTGEDLNAHIFVDAQTGTVFREDNLNHHGTADIWYHGNQNIDTKWYGGLLQRHRLIADDYGRNFTTMYVGKSTVPYDKDDTWGTNHHDATASHWFMMKSWDYFKNTFNRNGTDGAGSELYIRVGGAGNNAEYKPNQWKGEVDVLTFTTGQNQYYNRAIDIVGHEFTHGITHYASGLDNTFESGALHESFSDIFGTVIEAYAEGGLSDWLIGEDPNLVKQRSLINPKISGEHFDFVNGSYVTNLGQPDTYNGTYWFTGPLGKDKGGVHVNNGVQNHWFYLLANGGSGINDNNDNYTVQGIGLTKAALITYQNISNYIQTGSQYADARAGSLAFVQLNWGICSNEDIQATNAWYAVGVGGACTCNTTSVQQVETKLDFILFPNPSTGIITINTNNRNVQSIRIFSVSGNEVFVLENIQVQNNQIIDLSNAPNGVYFAEIKMNGYIVRKRIVISK